MRSLVLGILLFFILAQLLGVLTGFVLFFDSGSNPYVQAFYSPAEPNDLMNSVYLFGYVLVGAVIMLLLMRKVRNDLIFFIIEFGLIATASSLVFYAILRLFFLPTSYLGSMELAIVFGILLAVLKIFFAQFKNPAAIFASAGAGALFGVSLGIGPLLVFLILLAIYDYIAVFKTKHMVEFADYTVKKNLSFTVTSKMYAPELKKDRRIDLRTGDMIMPVMVEVALIPISPLASVFVFLGAVVALGVFLLVALKKKIVLPALPPIAAGMIVFFLLGKLIGIY